MREIKTNKRPSILRELIISLLMGEEKKSAKETELSSNQLWELDIHTLTHKDIKIRYA